MSSPERKLILSPDADDDYAQILRESERGWGRRQADEYEGAIDRVLDLLVDFPVIGRSRDDSRLGCRLQPVKEHVIIYEFDERAVNVLRIVHHRRDLSRLF